ncbi:inositol-3-phosphate synthase [Streptacidiphilus carbonis]|jgi:myo-inositol-1-phosphate synthase|uniref:inositol-3-phosphate synthase n=1 Tax=Streptacidiphilus carbonis TaxID=105422 RepID=UPI000A580E30|nr:inositol-3-phosphate synthase [Streptacidiphilus carbonis]
MPNIAIAGIGNCSSALVQALHGVSNGTVRHTDLAPGLESVPVRDIRITAAFDVDARKIGVPLEKAILVEPNCTTHYVDVTAPLPPVTVGALADGVSGPLADIVQVHEAADRTTAADIAAEMRNSGSEILVVFLPTGAQAAAELYADAAVRAGCSLVNCTPARLGRSATWQQRFRDAGATLLGDDMKSHIGSTTVHQALLSALNRQGVTVDATYQLNIGGNTDFLNLRDTGRSAAKRVTKATALRELVSPETAMDLGPSDHIAQLKDRKVGYIRIVGSGYLGMPFSMEVRLEVEDSPNSAAIAIDAVRAAASLQAGAELDLAAVLPALFKAPGLTGS